MGGSLRVCAGSSCPARHPLHRSADHPRVRGEQSAICPTCQGKGGSPPRARGAGDRGSASQWSMGITPACAGSSCLTDAVWNQLQDHPRVRGEQGHRNCVGCGALGSSPRARGAGHLDQALFAEQQITPACAGSRPSHRSGRYSAPDHPRVGGEQETVPVDELDAGGSPPRARGAAVRAGPADRRSGITPRVRGEQATGPASPRTLPGSPPRARGAGRRQEGEDPGRRITPACAGSSCLSRSTRRRPPDHPRVRGEQSAGRRVTEEPFSS